MTASPEGHIELVERHRLRQTLLPSRPSDATPVFHAMAGIPGSGKSTFVAQERGRRLPASAFVMNPDIVMESLSGYRSDVGVLGSAVAFRKWEMPARAFAHQLLDEARERRLNVIQDMACARQENVETLRVFGRAGFRVHVWHVRCPVAVALARVVDRERHTGRHTPPAMVYERDASITRLLDDIRSSADEYTVIEGV